MGSALYKDGLNAQIPIMEFTLMAADDEELIRTLTQREKDLEDMSVEELQEYIAELKAEITKVEAKITAKQAHMSDVEKLFKS